MKINKATIRQKRYRAKKKKGYRYLKGWYEESLWKQLMKLIESYHDGI